MSWRRVTWVVSSVAALAAAGFLVLLARGVEEASRLAESGDVQQAAAAAERAPRLAAGGELGRALIGTADDERFQRALGTIQRGRDSRLANQDVIKLHAEAISELGRIGSSGAAPALRSRAYALVGSLYAVDAQLDPGAGSRYLEQGVKALRLATKLDPGNEYAKNTLELVLRIDPPGSRAGAGAAEGSGFSSGAGSSGSGTGY